LLRTLSTDPIKNYQTISKILIFLKKHPWLAFEQYIHADTDVISFYEMTMKDQNYDIYFKLLSYIPEGTKGDNLRSKALLQYKNFKVSSWNQTQYEHINPCKFFEQNEPIVPIKPVSPEQKTNESIRYKCELL
jgi:hypothetical protein